MGGWGRGLRRGSRRYKCGLAPHGAGMATRHSQHDNMNMVGVFANANKDMSY